MPFPSGSAGGNDDVNKDANGIHEHTTRDRFIHERSIDEHTYALTQGASSSLYTPPIVNDVRHGVIGNSRYILRLSYISLYKHFVNVISMINVMTKIQCNLLYIIYCHYYTRHGVVATAGMLVMYILKYGR